MKPILFNTEMVRAIQADIKTATRRVVKPQPPATSHVAKVRYSWCWSWWEDSDGHQMKPPYRPGDILYVRETWRVWRAHRYDADAHIEFKAGGEGTVLRFPHGKTDSVNRTDYDSFIEKWSVGDKWHPSIHMPREAARIFLRVTDVRVEKLQDIRYEDCLREGITVEEIEERDAFHPAASAKWLYTQLWDATIKPADRALYGWDANPWVWIIEFERCKNPKESG